MQVVEALPLSDGFSVVDSRLARRALHSEFSVDPLHVDLQMELAHTTDDHLLRFFIDVDGEGRVFPLEFGQCFFQFDRTVVFGGFDGETHDWVWDEHALASCGEAVVCLREGVTGGAVDSKDGEDVTCLH